MSRLLDTFRSANASLASAKMRTALTILSILVGAFTLTLGLGVGAGLNDYIKQQVGTTDASDPLTVLRGELGAASASGLSVEEYDPAKTDTGVAALDADDLDAVRGVAGVERVDPVVSPTAEYIAYQGKKVTGSLGELLPTEKPELAAGSADGARRPGGVILGHAYLKALGISAPADAVGKKLDIVVVDQLRKAKNYPVTIVGVSKPSLLTNATISAARPLLEEMQTHQTSGIPELTAQVAIANAYLKPGADQATVKKAIEALDLTAATSQDQAASVSKSLQPIQFAVLGFSLVAIIASVFGIVNTLLMSVHERTREIGLLKSLGSRDRHIFGQFVAEALALGLWGSVIGMALALLAGGLISNVVASNAGDTFPGLDIFAASPGTLLGAPLLIGAIAVLAGVLPARRAMKLDPITALRYE